MSVDEDVTTLDALLEEISFRRKKDLRRCNGERGTVNSTSSGGASSSASRNTTYWTDLFVRHFLFQTDYEVDRDDLLFFIRHRNHLPSNYPTSSSAMKNEAFAVEVFRRDSRKLPIGEFRGRIAWEPWFIN